MNLRQYLISMLVGTVLCWVALTLVIINIDPFQVNALGFGFFYGSLFLALLGTFSIFTFVFYKIISRNEPMFKHVKKSFRDALFISFILTLVLFLQGRGVLNVWNLAIFIFTLFLIGAFIFSMKRSAV